MSHPTWVRGLKPNTKRMKTPHSRSHPTWVRGLKLAVILYYFISTSSHPTWVRGLKHNLCRLQVQKHDVAPYVGAWIETY